MYALVAACTALTAIGLVRRGWGGVVLTLAGTAPLYDQDDDLSIEAIGIDSSDDVTGSWTVGQLVSVAVPIRARASTLTVPRDALVLRHNGQFVFRINDDNNAEQIAVELGDSSGDMIAVSGALQEGDRVAIRGAENLRDGMDTKVLVSSLAASSDQGG